MWDITANVNKIFATHSVTNTNLIKVHSNSRDKIGIPVPDFICKRSRGPLKL